MFSKIQTPNVAEISEVTNLGSTVSRLKNESQSWNGWKLFCREVFLSRTPARGKV